MDINSISNGAVTANIKQNTSNTVDTAVASKAVGIQVESAGQLSNSVAKSAPTETHLGNKINTYA